MRTDIGGIVENIFGKWPVVSVGSNVENEED